MAQEVEKGFVDTKKGDALYDMLDQLAALVDLHERNSLNLAICGGL